MTKYVTSVTIRADITQREVRAMKDIARKIEDTFTEISFAEERNVGFPRNISGCLTERLDALFAAIAFAEAGEFDTARNFLSGGTRDGGRSAGYCLPGFCAGGA